MHNSDLYQIPGKFCTIDMVQIDAIEIENGAIKISLRSGFTIEAYSDLYQMVTDVKVYAGTEWENKSIHEIYRMLVKRWENAIEVNNDCCRT